MFTFNRQPNTSVNPTTYLHEGTPAQEKSMGRDLSEGHQRYDLTSYPGADLGDDHWERCIFEFWSLPKVKTVAA